MSLPQGSTFHVPYPTLHGTDVPQNGKQPLGEVEAAWQADQAMYVCVYIYIYMALYLYIYIACIRIFVYLCICLHYCHCYYSYDYCHGLERPKSNNVDSPLFAMAFGTRTFGAECLKD